MNHLKYWVLVLFVICGCTKDPVTGKRSFTVVNEAKEVQIGAEEDKKVRAILGVYEDNELGGFVDGLGQSIVSVSHRPNLKYTFAVVDSKVVNAFALPGGYIYVTRGLLAHMGSTDGLVGVMSHEVGHVAGRHSAELISKSIVASGFGVLNVVSAIAPSIGGLLSAPSQLLMLSYSRKQEEESDRLGVEYTTRLGYDARELARFFEILKGLSAENGKEVPTFLSTHPDSDKRADTVNELSAEWQKEIGWKERAPDVDGYLARIDGLVFGDDPRQGYTEEGWFHHPNMRFSFPYPKDWELSNSRIAVLIVAPEGRALMQLMAEEAASPGAVAAEAIDKGNLTVTSDRFSKVSGLDAYIMESTADRGRVRLLSYFIQMDSLVYTFHCAAAAKDFRLFKPEFEKTMEGFQRASDPKVLDVEPNRVRTKTLDSETTLQDYLSAHEIPADLFESVGQINGVPLDKPLKKGTKIKIITKD